MAHAKAERPKRTYGELKEATIDEFVRGAEKLIAAGQ